MQLNPCLLLTWNDLTALLDYLSVLLTYINLSAPFKKHNTVSYNIIRSTNQEIPPIFPWMSDT